MTALIAIIKSFFANTAFVLTAVILMLISGFFAFLGGRILQRLNIESDIVLFSQLGLFILCYSVLAQLARSRF